MAPEQAGGNPAEMREACDIFRDRAPSSTRSSAVSCRSDESDSVDETLRRTSSGEVIPIDRAVAGLGVSNGCAASWRRRRSRVPKDRYATVLELQCRRSASFLRGGLHLPRKVFRRRASIILREGDVGDAAYMIIQRPLPRVHGGRWHPKRRIGFVEAAR
jgi:hypothetical protein